MRTSNLELFRIVAMLGIIMSHYQFFLLDLISVDPSSPIAIFQSLFSMWGKTGINCFMLITGYFMCTKEISKRKYIKLIVQIYFYNILIQGIFMCIGIIPVNILSILNILMPFRHINMSNFITVFLLFYLFIPFVAILIRNLSQENHKKLAILSTSVYIIYNTIPGFSMKTDAVVWFIIIMIISSYIRFYNPKILLKISSGGVLFVSFFAQ